MSTPYASHGASAWAHSHVKKRKKHEKKHKVPPSGSFSTSSQSCSLSQSQIPYLICVIENLLIDVINGFASFIEAGIQELINYVPIFVNIPMITNIGYVFNQTVASVPLLGNVVNLLGKLLTF
jgi:hypothetical protein|uniref:Uncharacterized protein n=1 Tax=Candidatus Aramenus sulfurataquae TaxID=1326980 RepID=A0A0F2LPH1_9CREN